MDEAPPTPDATLVLDCLQGDTTAWEALYARHHAAIYNFLAQRLRGNAALCDDLFQETMLKIVSRLAQFDPARGSFHGWAYGIAINQLRDHGRRLRREETKLLGLRAMGPPEATVRPSGTESRETVALVCSLLSPRHQQVLELKYARGCSMTEIAERLGTGAQAVGSLLHRARAAFRLAYARVTETE